MKNTLYFPSYAEFVQRSELLKDRQERLIQVRQNEKKKAVEFLDRMRTRAQDEYETTEKYLMNEICELHSKELAAMRHVYEECIAKINQEHYNKTVLPKAVSTRSSVRPLMDKNVLRKKSPVKTIVICEDSFNASATNVKWNQARNHENIDCAERKRKLSPVKRTFGNEIQNKVEVRTTSVYHEKCVPSQRSTSPKKKPVSVRSVQTTPNLAESKEQMTKKTFSVKSIQTTPNLIMVGKDLVNEVVNPAANSFLKQSTEDFLNSYTQRVHDRIRILEQKERMLQRRAIFLPECNRLTIVSPVKDRITDVDVKVTRDESDVTESKNNLSTKTDAQPITVLSSKSVATNTEVNVDLITKKICDTAVQTSRLCRKKSRRCKRTSLARNEDMVILIRNHQNEISSTMENEKPDEILEPLSSNTSRDNESSSNEPEQMGATDQRCVQSTAHAGEKRLRSRKLENWRRLFVNGEKLSESSYYSPPDSSRAVRTLSMSKKKKCKRYLSRKKAVDEGDAADLGYYVAKLLLMSPESVENLNTVNDDTVTSLSVDDVPFEKPESSRLDDDDDDSMDEEEFLRRILEVKFPAAKTAEEEAPPVQPSPPKPRIFFNSSATIAETDVKSTTSSITSSDRSKTSSKDERSDPKQPSKSDAKFDSKLSGWIEASIKRTLEASAVNSTSSYDEHDSVRQVDQLVLSLIEKNEYFLSGEKSPSSSSHFSFSPVAVPNIHLNVPRLSGTST